MQTSITTVELILEVLFVYVVVGGCPREKKMVLTPINMTLKFQKTQFAKIEVGSSCPPSPLYYKLSKYKDMNKLTLINPYIHQEAKLKKDKFLDRIKNVQQIRACYLERNFLPGEDIEWEILEELHKAINTGMFSFGISNYKIFAFEINKELYDWFKNNDLKTIQKQVINWIAAAYLSRPDMQEYLDEYIYYSIKSLVFFQFRFLMDVWVY